MVITDEIRVVIAAQACLLLPHRDTGYYPDLKSILVYPSTYFSRVTEEDEAQQAAFSRLQPSTCTTPRPGSKKPRRGNPSAWQRCLW